MVKYDYPELNPDNVRVEHSVKSLNLLSKSPKTKQLDAFKSETKKSFSAPDKSKTLGTQNIKPKYTRSTKLNVYDNLKNYRNSKEVQSAMVKDCLNARSPISPRELSFLDGMRVLVNESDLFLSPKQCDYLLGIWNKVVN